MSVIEIIYPAKCKDCKCCTLFYKGKRKFNKCINSESYKSKWKNITLKDKACEYFIPTWHPHKDCKNK